MALKVRAATFVNIKGKPGKNKAADLHKRKPSPVLDPLVPTKQSSQLLK